MWRIDVRSVSLCHLQMLQKLMRKTRRNRGRNAEFYVIKLTLAADQPTEFHTGEELTADQRESFRSLLYEDFPELLHP
jgi:hypothetical protein